MAVFRDNWIDGDYQTTQKTKKAVAKKEGRKNPNRPQGVARYVVKPEKRPGLPSTGGPDDTKDQGFREPDGVKFLRWLENVWAQGRSNSRSRITTTGAAPGTGTSWKKGQIVTTGASPVSRPVQPLLGPKYDANGRVPDGARLVNGARARNQDMIFTTGSRGGTAPGRSIGIGSSPSVGYSRDAMKQLEAQQLAALAPMGNFQYLDKGREFESELALQSKGRHALGNASTANDREAYDKEPINFSAMTWEQYEALPFNERAMVDANTLIREAVDADQRLIKKFDANADGRLTYQEARRKDEQSKNYETAFKGAFGERGETGRSKAIGIESTTYAPNTVAALNLLGLKDRTGGIDDYLSGSAYITEDDMNSIAKEKRFTGASGNGGRSARDTWLADIASKMQQFSDSAAQGRIAQGETAMPFKVANAGSDTYKQLVNDLVADLQKTDTFAEDLNATVWNYSKVGKSNLGSLVDPNQAARFKALDGVFTMLTTTEGGAQYIEGHDKELQQILDINETNASLEDWAEYLSYRRNQAETGKAGADYVPGGPS